MIQDLRHALRTLARSPGFAAAAIATLALGIGANTAIFSIVRSVLWRPLPFADSERLVRVGHVRPSSVRPDDTFSPQDFDDLVRTPAGFSRVAAFNFVPGLTGMNLTGSGEPARIQTAFVSGSFFSTLGAPAALGRTLASEEDVSGRDRVVVLSRGLWASRFGADRGIVGRTVRLDGKPFTVAGVMPEDFAFPSRAVDAWVPLSLVGEDDVPHKRHVRWFAVVARLSPGVSLAAARAATDGLFQRLAATYPDSNAGFEHASLEPLSDSIFGDLRRPLTVLLAAVGMVLLILCANLGGLLLARGSARRREIAIRVALGASRARVIRHLLMETAVLCAIGGTLGLAVAFWAVTLLPATAGELPRAVDIRLDPALVGFTLALSILTGLLFGLAPAVQAARASLASALQSRGRGGSPDRNRRTLLRTLVVCECLLAGVLLTGAGLLGKSFWRLAQSDPGIRAAQVLAISLSIPMERYSSPPEQDAYRDRILDRLRALPGVKAVGASKTMPLAGGGEPYGFFVEGRPESEGRIRPEAGAIIVTTGYFAALGVPILAGRPFSRDDMEQKRRVIVVNEAWAKQLWPGRSAVGKVLSLGKTARLEVIGVVGNIRHAGLARPAGGAAYVPVSLFPRSSMKIFLRFSGDPASTASAARKAVWSVDRDQPIAEIATLPDVVSRSVARPKFFMLLLVAFGAAALALAAIGLYGTLSYGTRQRRREMGIRLALGAQRRDVVRLVLEEGTSLALLGVVLAIPASLAASRLLGSLLFDVAPQDPLVLICVVVFLLAVGAGASFLPARSASRVDPAIALRQD
ncbi:MAG: ABC transporter permease [Acidobacteria bacterium]|nr:ABC transporter permease [Acidobacteriota bacterium]